MRRAGKTVMCLAAASLIAFLAGIASADSGTGIDDDLGSPRINRDYTILLAGGGNGGGGGGGGNGGGNGGNNGNNGNNGGDGSGDCDGSNDGTQTRERNKAADGKDCTGSCLS